MFEVPASARAAWRDPPKDLEMRHWVLSYALLAPNPHNMQPWLADIATAGEITLHLDPQRLLPASDPYGRQILMGAGAFLELLSMAAAKRGQRAEVTLSSGSTQLEDHEAGSTAAGSGLPSMRSRYRRSFSIARRTAETSMLKRRAE
jgi:hypothetical protein